MHVDERAVAARLDQHPERQQYGRGREQRDVGSEPQPHRSPWLTAISKVTSQPDISSAVPTLIRPGARSGDSGTKNSAATAATRVMIIGIQNSQW